MQLNALLKRTSEESMSSRCWYSSQIMQSSPRQYGEIWRCRDFENEKMSPAAELLIHTMRHAADLCGKASQPKCVQWCDVSGHLCNIKICLETHTCAQLLTLCVAMALCPPSNSTARVLENVAHNEESCRRTCIPVCVGRNLSVRTSV